MNESRLNGRGHDHWGSPQVDLLNVMRPSALMLVSFRTAGMGCVSSHKARATELGSMPIFRHHLASSP